MQPSSSPSGQDPAQLKDLQHRNHVLQAQVQELEDVKRRLQVEQRTATEWREKWNLQNFKLNLLVVSASMGCMHELYNPGATCTHIHQPTRVAGLRLERRHVCVVPWCMCTTHRPSIACMPTCCSRGGGGLSRTGPHHAGLAGRIACRLCVLAGTKHSFMELALARDACAPQDMLVLRVLETEVDGKQAALA